MPEDGALLHVSSPGPNTNPWDSTAKGTVSPAGALVKGKVVISGTPTVVQERQIVSDLMGAFTLVFSLNPGTYDLFVGAPAIAIVDEIDVLTVGAG
jgi:hypothetical protein